MLLVIVCGCGTWSFTFREAHRLKVLVRKICGPKRKEIAAEWRKLHNEKLIRVIKSRRISWAGHVSRTAAGDGI